MELTDYLRKHLSIVEQLKFLETEISDLILALHETIEKKGKIYLCGNGGSAADAQHIAAELVGSFTNKHRKALSAIALSTDSSCVTSISNDFSYDQVFSRQIEAHCSANDLIILISTSGNSKNLLNAATSAHKIGAKSIGLLGGTGGELINRVDVNITVPSATTSIIQECHMLIGHFICYKMDEIFANR